MSILDRLLGRRRTVTQLTPAELRKKEIVLRGERDRMLKQVEKITAEKQKIFDRGAQQRNPEMRKVLAMEFQAKTAEQLSVSRRITERSKQLLLVNQLRIIAEEKARDAQNAAVVFTAADMVRARQSIGAHFSTEAASADMLNELLETIDEENRDAINAATIGSEGTKLMALWEQVDKGTIDATAAFDAAEKEIRARTGESV